MSTQEQDGVRASLEGWDAIIIASQRLPCIFDREFEESLSVAGTQPMALVANVDVVGGSRRVTIVDGTTQCDIKTREGEAHGPFVIEVQEAGDPGLRMLRLRLV